MNTVQLNKQSGFQNPNFVNDFASNVYVHGLHRFLIQDKVPLGEVNIQPRGFHRLLCKTTYLE